MLTLNDLMALLEDFMGHPGDKDPHMPNGLQVRGREEINLLATGVSASMRLFEEAVARNPGVTSREQHATERGCVSPAIKRRRCLVRDRQFGYH